MYYHSFSVALFFKILLSFSPCRAAHHQLFYSHIHFSGVISIIAVERPEKAEVTVNTFLRIMGQTCSSERYAKING